MKKPKALIIGGGKGKEIKHLLSIGYEIHSIDPGYTKDQHKGNLFLHKSKIQDFKLEKYQIAIANNSLQFLKRDAKKEIKRICKSAPVFVGTIPIKFRSKFINKNCSVDFKKIIKSLKPVYLNEYWIEDEPHKGTNFKHKHYMMSFLFINLL